MKLTIISDTHSDQEKLGSMSGDVLIHCGDMFNFFNSDDDEFDRMDEWFAKQDFELILCIGGNHDFELQKRASYTKQPFKNAVYLEGSAYQYKGVNFFGAPWVPDLYGQAYYTEHSELANRWANIPNNVDVLITHTPPGNILDKSSQGLVLGCEHLLTAVERAKPKLHCFGHIHHSSGSIKKGGTCFINAALADHHHKISKPPFQFEI